MDTPGYCVRPYSFAPTLLDLCVPVYVCTSGFVSVRMCVCVEHMCTGLHLCVHVCIGPGM